MEVLSPMTTVTITRAKQYPVVARPGPAWRWIYQWTADDGTHVITMPDGRIAYAGSYGPGLGSLVDMLRRKYGRQVVIVKAWQS